MTIRRQDNVSEIMSTNNSLNNYQNISHLLNKSDIKIDKIQSNVINGSEKWKIHNNECCVFFDKNDICAVTYKDATSNSNKKVFKNVQDACYHIK